jgi:hypothetical protein
LSWGTPRHPVVFFVVRFVVFVRRRGRGRRGRRKMRNSRWGEIVVATTRKIIGMVWRDLVDIRLIRRTVVVTLLIKLA